MDIPGFPDPGRHRRGRLQVGTAEDLRPGRSDEALAPPAAEQPPTSRRARWSTKSRAAAGTGRSRKWISWYPDAKLSCWHWSIARSGSPGIQMRSSAVAERVGETEGGHPGLSGSVLSVRNQRLQLVTQAIKQLLSTPAPAPAVIGACRSEQLKTAVLVVRMKHWLHQQQGSRPAAAISS
ncbi:MULTISPECIES: hypothetical protein [Paenibacillus]|uniref:hypothetical protein n=1 Tax=Paenibacillus TaxID=44249 RepID=UPI001BCC54EF|nr:hypothetical protein [Paenibacillus dendritiformis]